MIYLYIRQTVADYARWKEGFDRHLSSRQAGGATLDAWVLRNVENPNEIVVVLGWGDVAKAKLFVQSGSRQRALRKSSPYLHREIWRLARIFAAL